MRLGFTDGTGGKKSAYQCRRHRRRGFNPWVGNIPQRRKWQAAPVFLSGADKNSTYRTPWWAAVHEPAKHWTWLSN